MTVLVTCLWLVVVALGAFAFRPAPVRMRRLAARRVHARSPWAGTGRDHPSRTGWSFPAVLGRVVRRRLGRPPVREADARLGWALLMGTAAALVAPALVVPVVAVWWALPLVQRRRERRRADLALVHELPEVVDLFVLAVGAGLTVPLAVSTVARHHRGVIGGGLARASRRAALGARLADALAELPAEIGERCHRLTTVLVASERYGVALLPALERLAAETRLDRRRQSEAAARRVPVKLLFPLVLCTLPAFALLTVVPLLAGSLRSLRL